MALKPLTNPEWATSNPTDPSSGQPAILTPSVGKIASGFLRHEYPPRQDLNWFFNLVSLWVTYLEEFTDEHEAELIGNTADIATNTSDITTNSIAIGLNTTHRTGNGSDHANVATNTANINQIIAQLTSPAGAIIPQAGVIAVPDNKCKYLMLNDSLSNQGSFVQVEASFDLTVAAAVYIDLSLGVIPGISNYFKGFATLTIYISAVPEIGHCFGVTSGGVAYLRVFRLGGTFPVGSHSIFGSFVGSSAVI